MGRLIVDAATSMDGFWADADGQSVLPLKNIRDARLSSPSPAGCGAVVMSQRSLESSAYVGRAVQAYAAHVPVFVVGDDMATAGHGKRRIRFVETYPAAFAAARAEAGDKAVLVLGEAGALGAALQSGEADEIWLRVVSRTLGAGAPLFDDGAPVDGYFVSEMETTPDTVHLHLERRLD